MTHLKESEGGHVVGCRSTCQYTRSLVQSIFGINECPNPRSITLKFNQLQNQQESSRVYINISTYNSMTLQMWHVSLLE